MTDEPFRKGQYVRVTAHRMTAIARIELASADGASLMLAFDGGLSTAAGGMYVGYMPVLRGDDGQYRELINRTVIFLEPAPGV